MTDKGAPPSFGLPLSGGERGLKTQAPTRLPNRVNFKMSFNEAATIVFEQYWQGVEWAAKQSFSGDELSYQVKRISEPNRELCDLLTKMHGAFYPNESHQSLEDAKQHVRNVSPDFLELKHGRFLPWVLHQALYALKNDKTLNATSYEDIIKNILEKEWLLSWHWRAVLPSLRLYPPEEGDALVIQISHVRKWEMLLCYSVLKEDLEDHHISEIPLRSKTLWRAPLFGLSHRLKGWDTYRLFYQDHIADYIRAEHKGVTRSHMSGKLAEAYVLGRHDCYYLVDRMEPIKGGYKWTLKTLMDMEPEIALIDREILGSTSVYYRPTDLIDIPTFAPDHEGIPQLLSSDSYCEAFLELTEVLNDPTARSVLLIAPPGSGKEKLAESAFHCREQAVSAHDQGADLRGAGRDFGAVGDVLAGAVSGDGVDHRSPVEPAGRAEAPERRLSSAGRFVATTLAGLDATEAAKLLFAVGTGTLDNRSDPLDGYEPADNQGDGLLLQALGGALFIDEIDKTDESIRNLLLRVLESGEITVPDSSRILKIKREQIPLYIFAASMNRQSVFQERPPDFWTRISHVIEVAHPLALDDTEKARKVVKDYLWMFWCIHVRDFMKRKGVTGPDKTSAVVGPLNEYYRSLYSFLIDKTVVDFATNILTEEVSGRGKPLVSIRTLRSVVARSVFKFVDVLLYSKSDVDPVESLKEEKKAQFGGADPREWFDELLRIIKPADKRQHGETNAPNLDAIEFAAVESFRSAIRVGAALAR